MGEEHINEKEIEIKRENIKKKRSRRDSFV